MPLTVRWGRHLPVTVESTEALDALVARLAAEASDQHRPMCLEVSTSAETALKLTVGAEISHLEFFSANSHPPVNGSHGLWDQTDYIELDCLGELSYMQRRYFVPMAEALAALREYVLTGLRPSNVKWGL
jgi:hypothetical protein